MKYKDYYEVYEDGRIYSYKSNKFMKPFCVGSNYLGVAINRKPEYVHRIVASCYIEKIDGKTEINHKDKNKFNNSVENLEWVTHKENIIHSFKTDRGAGFVKGKSGFEGLQHTNEWKSKHSERMKKSII
jgi:hypothetical protein